MTGQHIRPTRWAIAALIAVFGLIGATACSSSSKNTGSPGQPTKPAVQTPWQQTLAKVKPDGSVDVSTALTAFALAIGPVPGVTPPAGSRDDITSATVAVRWVTRVWSKLTAAQQAAIRTDLGAKATGTHRIIGPDNAAATAPSSRPNIPCQTKDSAKAEPYRGAFDAIVAEMEAHLWPLRVRDHVFFSENTSQVDQTGAPAYAVGCVGTDDQVDRISGCTIHFDPVGSAHGSDADFTAQVLVHEVTHCFIMSRFGGQAESLMPDWYGEGAPDWVAATLASGDPTFHGWWHRYLDLQTTPLSQQTYDGMGFFVHLNESGVDPWKAISAIGVALAKSPSTTAGWNASGANGNQEFLDTWGSGFAQERYPGTAWRTTAPNLDQYQPPITRENDLANEGNVPFSSNAQASGLLKLNVSAEIVLVKPDAGASGRISLGNGTDATLSAAADKTYCTLSAENCTCPKDSPGEGTTFTPMEKGTQYVGITGGLAKATMHIQGQSFEEFCKTPKSPLIGAWQAVSTKISSDPPGLRYRTAGGAGYTMTISSKGQLTLNYAGITPPSYTVTFLDLDETVHTTVKVSGTDTATLDLKRPSVWAPTNLKAGIKEAAHSDTGADMAGAGMFIGPVLSGSWTITGKTLTVRSKPDPSTTGSWVFTKIK